MKNFTENVTFLHSTAEMYKKHKRKKQKETNSLRELRWQGESE